MIASELSFPSTKSTNCVRQQTTALDYHFPANMLWNSWIHLSLRNESVERIYLNECISDAFIPDNVKPDIDREIDAKTYSRVETV
jgi:hypothetical protein